VIRHTIALVMRPPSSGNAGTRLKARISTFISTNQLSDSSTGVMLPVVLSVAASNSRCGPTMPSTAATHRSRNPNVASGPAAEILKSSPGLAASRLMCVIPPNRNKSIRLVSIPSCLATSAWPSSCSTSEQKNSSTVTTVVRYATPSEECSVARNGPESQKIIRNKTRNQLASTPIRIPNRSTSFIEPDRLNMMQWSHSDL
jgi:hypothetical protein